MKLKDGRYLNDRLATYIIPTHPRHARHGTVLIENPGPTGPQGAKGVGELPMDGAAAALVQAVENATGIAAARIPATPEVLLETWRAGGAVEGTPDCDEEIA